MFSELKQKVTSWEKQALIDPNKTQLFSPSATVSQIETHDGVSPKGKNVSKSIANKFEPAEQITIN